MKRTEDATLNVSLTVTEAAASFRGVPLGLRLTHLCVKVFISVCVVFCVGLWSCKSSFFPVKANQRVTDGNKCLCTQASMSSSKSCGA